MDRRQLNILLGVIIAILLVIIGFMAFSKDEDNEGYVAENKVVVPEAKQPVTPTTPPAEEEKPAADETASWKTYENKELGFSFKYPSEYGTFNLSIDKAEEGKLFRGGFPGFSEVWKNNKFFTLGGITQDFGQGRSGYFLDFVRYTNDSGRYYHIMAQNKKYAFKPVKTLTVDGQKVLIVDGSSYPDDAASELGFGPGANGGALVNLPGNGEFAGLAIWNSDIKKLPQAEFEQILSTFKFNR